MAELGKETVDLSALVGRAAEESFLSLKELVESAKSTEVSDSDKKVSLLRFVFKTQQRMLRLISLTKWCKQVPLIDFCQDLGSILISHDTSFTQAADSLFYMHEGLQQACAPVYDVPSAVEVLLTGSYKQLPKCLDDVGMHGSLDEHQQKQALRKLDVLVRSKLLEVTLPKGITEVKVSKGIATLSVEGEFKVLVTLGYRENLSMWRILHLDLLVGERSGPVKLEATRRHVIGDDLERRMSVAQNPFTILYAVLHELCVAIVMDTVIRQVQSLLQGRWKNVIRFELILDSGTTPVNQEGEADSASLLTPGVKLMYWSDSDKTSGPFIRIEPGSGLQIRCSHSTFVIDPRTSKEAKFSLNKSCVDVEKLLRKAIRCNRYTRLFEIQKELLRNARICRASSDVIFQSFLDDPGVEGGNIVDSKKRVEPEVLRVRACGSSFISLGINIRSGRFLLQSSKSILDPSVLEEHEDALNRGSISASEAFINLRIKSILHVFAAIGKFLGLEVCDRGFGINKVSKSLSDRSNVLTLGFPDCENSHFLLVELEKDFTPSFKLVEPQVDDSGNVCVSRAKKIDIEKIGVLEDDLNLITSDMVRFVSSFSDAKGLNKASSHNHPVIIDEALEETSGRQSSFSSTVDEVFGLHEGTSSAGKGVTESGAQTADHATTSDDPLLRKDQKFQKLSDSDLLRWIPSLRGVEGVVDSLQKRRTSGLEQSESNVVATSTKTNERSYGNLIDEANKGNAPSSVYLCALLHVVRRSSLSIKHAKLTSQMEALDIPYVEKNGLRNEVSDIWFKFPFAQNDSWLNICLQLGRTGNMCWDVKVNDRYFRDLSELEKGSKTTPWGPGVHILNSPDLNSHTDYDPKGVVLSYQSVEADSIKKLMADLQRLSNARMFSLAMEKLVGIKSDERPEEGTACKGIGRWRLFKIVAVGLTSLWFNLGGLEVTVHFVVEWEPGRDGCTMRVSPHELWPNTKFLEDFVNGAEVDYLLDCILLASGPLLSVASVTRTVPGLPASSHEMLSSSLFPMDVAIVRTGPFRIRIFYRKSVAIDMRCFVRDQVWLQPATPLRGGGYLPCPQFRKLIMELVAQESNVLEPNLTGSQGAMNPNSSNPTGSVDNRGGNGGGWVPVVVLRRVLPHVFRYLGVLWLVAQLPDLITEILGSILKKKEGALRKSDPELPYVSFFVRGYSFFVSVHKFRPLLLIKQNGSSAAPPNEELTQSESEEACDYFSRRVASEPYNPSRAASFITLLTLPIPVLREFLKMIAWKKGLPRIQLCLENHSGAAKSNIHYSRPNNTVDFALIFVLNPAHIPQTNLSGQPYCVSVRLRYTFGDNLGVTFLGMEGSHRGDRACWQLVEDWEKCKQRVSHTVEEVKGSSVAQESSQGKLKSVAENIQRTLQLSLQDIRES